MQPVYGNFQEEQCYPYFQNKFHRTVRKMFVVPPRCSFVPAIQFIIASKLHLKNAMPCVALP